MADNTTRNNPTPWYNPAYTIVALRIVNTLGFSGGRKFPNKNFFSFTSRTAIHSCSIRVVLPSAQSPFVPDFQQNRPRCLLHVTFISALNKRHFFSFLLPRSFVPCYKTALRSSSVIIVMRHFVLDAGFSNRGPTCVKLK